MILVLSFLGLSTPAFAGGLGQSLEGRLFPKNPKASQTCCPPRFIQKAEWTRAGKAFSDSIDQLRTKVRYRFDPAASFGMSMDRGVEVGFRLAF